MAKIPVEQIVALCQEVFPGHEIGGSMKSAFVEIPSAGHGITSTETQALEARGLRVRSAWLDYSGVMIVQVVSA